MYPFITPSVPGYPSSPVAQSSTNTMRRGDTYEVPFYANAAYYPNWRLSDEWADSQMPVDGVEGCLRAFTQMKQQYSELKVILSVGGGGKGSENFARVARSHAAIQAFVGTARELIDQFGLDGIDIDWEHPSDPQQGRDYLYLLSQLREALPSPRFILVSSLPAGEWALRNIDLSAVQGYLDLINVMAYDFSGPWIGLTGHQAQLFTPSRPHNEAALVSCHSGISYMLSQGVDPKKILLGVPAYGRSFLGCDNINQSYSGGGGQDGTFDYCDLPRPGSKEYHDDAVGAAYCTGGDGGFVTYDTPRIVQQKARYVTKMGLGGLFYWHITGDKRGPKSLIETGFNTLHDM